MKIALGVEYDGSHYSGWQRQQHSLSIQQKLEESLSIIANTPITISCAGRTDAGVHATGQVIHFETESIRPLSAWSMGVNANLPSNIAIKWAQIIDNSFHARFSAQARRYRYIIYNHQYRHAILSCGITHYHQQLDEVKMNLAAQYLLGENDFTTFRASQCQSLSPCRNIHHISVTRQSRYVIIDVQANAFVHHMVRNIVGSLIEVGNGKQSVDWVDEILHAKNRTLAAATAKPEGLYLVDVIYPPQFTLPRMPLGPLFIT